MIRGFGGSPMGRVCRTRMRSSGPCRPRCGRLMGAEPLCFEIAGLEGKGGACPATGAAQLAAPSPLGAAKIHAVQDIRSSARLATFES